MAVVFKIRPIEENDLLEVQRIIKEGRIELFNYFHKKKVLYNFKIQIPLVVVAYGATYYLNLNNACVFVISAILNCVAYYKHYSDFKCYFSSNPLNDIRDWQAVKSNYHRPGCKFVVATADREGREVIAGCGGLKRPEGYQDIRFPDNTYEGAKLAVVPEFRRRGLAKLLFAEMENHINEQHIGGKTNLILVASEIRTVALQIYKKKGYKVIKVYKFTFLFGLVSHNLFVFLKRPSSINNR